MGLVSETIAEPLDLKSRPSLVPERCVNCRQRRYPCARCADICPHRVFPHKSGEALSWDCSSGCSLCVELCPHGGLDRLKYPMKRKNWSPENPTPELRGIDEWERISWDEAATYIHDEIERINGTYGDNSILALGAGCTSLLNKLNINYLTSWSTMSWGTWYCPDVLGWNEGCKRLPRLSTK